MPYINNIEIPNITKREKFPFAIVVSEISSEATMIIVSATRIIEQSSDPPPDNVNIAPNINVDQNKYSVSNIWLEGETPKPGKYRLLVLASNSATPEKVIESNIIVNVLD
jgi:hypothetical protein